MDTEKRLDLACQLLDMALSMEAEVLVVRHQSDEPNGPKTAQPQAVGVTAAAGREGKRSAQGRRNFTV